MKKTTFVVFGDIHGKQDLMYETAIELEKEIDCSIDAILQVGDFETIRTNEDFEHYYAPRKYHKLSDIKDYFRNFKEAPFLTFFIGGNHEAWSVLAKNHDGFFLCPNVYFMGRSSIVNFKGVKIGGLTGVFERGYYKTPLSETPDYSWKYYRREAVEKLRGSSIDILLLHDWVWPLSKIDITSEENIAEDMRQSEVISPTYSLIEQAQPKHVFMGHLHSRCLEGTIGASKIIN